MKEAISKAWNLIIAVSICDIDGWNDIWQSQIHPAAWDPAISHPHFILACSLFEWNGDLTTRGKVEEKKVLV